LLRCDRRFYEALPAAGKEGATGARASASVHAPPCRMRRQASADRPPRRARRHWPHAVREAARWAIPGGTRCAAFAVRPGRASSMRIACTAAA